MRLSDVLSKKPKDEYIQVEGFLQGKKGNTGQKVDIDAGRIALNFFCGNCEDLRTFYSGKKLSCIFVNPYLVSIDCVLKCGGCGNTVPVWFLVESKNAITDASPKIRILKRNIKLSENVRYESMDYGDCTTLLNKAKQAYNDGLGAGSIVYLRKVYEKITIQTANAMNIEYDHYEGGNPKNFSNLLKKVDEKCKIIPTEFSENGYKLFRELSGVVHGDYDEDLGLRKFDPLYRLVVGILENIKNRKEYISASEALGWETDAKE